jgi:hypothetical protein
MPLKKPSRRRFTEKQMVHTENKNIMKFKKWREGLFSDYSKAESSLNNI